MTSFEVNYEEDLIDRIKDLIDGYDKNSILKEYLQNADDSGATELIVTFDKQDYSKLNNTKFEHANSSSLLLYNNSQFKEKDFKSIVKISAKGKADDPNSTGRFGQGFSSSFSISDHPSFVSNKRAYWFDVQRDAVSKNKDKSIQGWDYTNPIEIKEWLNTFNIAGFNKDFKGTIFRLPLRNEKTSTESLISNEIFTFNDFLKWIQEWKDNSDNLLFLRHLHRLVLQEVDEYGNKIIHLEINTKNKDEIENINNQIQKEFEGKALLEICEEWESNSKGLPFFRYKHEFEIKYIDTVSKQYTNENKVFAITNGLFRGTNNNLTKSAKKALKIEKNPRKVLPWVGVAVEVDDKNQPIKNKSKLFTFLPLPIKSNYPIHIHGWFDLNPKRTEITSVGSGYDKETLVEWNRLLIEEGVAKAWALLIDYLKIDKNSHYSFWAKDTEFALNKELIEGFYKKISELKCLYTIHKETKRWLSPKENSLYYFKDEKNQILLDAFKEHFPIVYPKPPKFIIENFKEVDVELIEITPEFIRDYLQEKSEDITFPIAIKKIPITMLQKKEWLIEIIKYCADNGEDYSLLGGLPIELTLNKSIYTVESKTLFDKNPNLKLFQDMKQLYIDVDIINSIENSDKLPSSWLEPTLKNQIELLSQTSYWDKLDITKEWLAEVVSVITTSRQEEFDEAEDIIKELQLVYQENNEYGKLESDVDEYSPFMPRDEDIENNLIYLDEISMNVVHHEYVEIYKPLLKYEGLITQLTSETLMQHLLLLDSFEFFRKQETREYLVDILTEDISWFDELINHQITTMPFIETVANNIYSKDTDIKLFLPTNFTPPKHIKSLDGEYEIIAVEKNSNLYELYLKMGLTEQNINSYIQKIIIPFLESHDNYEDKKDVLKWLSVEWNDIKDDIEEEILEELKESSIIPSLLDEQELYKASELYIPTVELGKIFNDGLYMPISFSDEEIQVKWIELLSDLGSSKDILSQHIISKVEKIIEENNQLLAIDLLNFMANKFEVFEKMDILDKLKDYAWFPVERVNDILKSRTEYSKLKKADELILYDDRKIGGGYYHILSRSVNLGKKDDRGEYSEKEMAERLGIIRNIPKEHFFESFRELMKLSPTDGQVVNYAKEVYNYIGKRFKSERVDFDIEERTILIDNQWIAPKYVYKDIPPLSHIKSWEALVKNETESNLAKGLISLGVQEKPTLDFFIEELKTIPKERSLNSNQLDDARNLLILIQKEKESIDCDELPILTPYNQLVISSKLYINDFPAYKNASDKNEDLYFCQTQFERLAKGLNVLTLSENYTSKIDSVKESNNGHSIINILERDSFKEGILRLLYHEKKIQEDEINESLLEEVLPSRIIFISQLIIEYSIENEFLFRSDETTYEDDGELYILEQDDEDDMISLISEYICDKKDLSRKSFDWIGRILRKQMEREDIQILLDKQNVKELPQKFDISEELSLFRDSNVLESNSEIVYDSSTSQEENHPQEGSKPKGERPPPSQPKTSKRNSSNVSNRNSVSSSDRKRVHVYADNDKESNKNKNLETLKEKGDRGEDYIIKNQINFVQSKDNYLEKAQLNNKGFDIFEKNSDGEIIRYIEVKSKDGIWGDNGVSITKFQFQFAKEKQDKWWLFVVENSKTDNPKVYMFKNPIITISDFMLDGSWKQLAYKKDSIVNHEPKVGDSYEVNIDNEVKVCKIIKIIKMGALFKVELMLENTRIVKKKFDKSWRRL